MQSQVARAAAIQGRDQSYVLPPFSVRMLSMVPADAADIRDGTVETFTDIDERAFRASVLIVVGGILFGLAGLMTLLEVVRLVGRYRQPAVATTRLVSDFAILRAIGRELRAVQPPFPLYGSVGLDQGATYSHALLEHHGAIVRPEVLTALEVKNPSAPTDRRRAP